MADRRYVTLAPLRFGGNEFATNVPVALPEAEGDRLALLGAVAPQAGALPAMPPGPPVPVMARSSGEGMGNIASLVRALDPIISGAITRDANGAAISAPVTFPDGVTGVYTAIVVSSAFPGAVDAYQVTYGADTYTQPAVTRNAAGAVTNRPAITYVKGV